jgi:hypothetical protein
VARPDGQAPEGLPRRGGEGGGDDGPSDGWTVEAAADWAWARGHLEGWQHLVVERGWSSEDHEVRVVRSVLAEVLASAG